MKLAKERKISFTVCPVSNVKIGPIPSLEQHPIQKMMDFGLTVTVNSDDPAFLNASLTDTFKATAQALKWSEDTIITLVKNSVEATFLPEERKEELRRDIFSFLRSFTEDN
eukprot:TRINITY_DN612_c0_g1_i2.p1 TRINITY_DN612_c0_g1~~TRINITY_DN612_c0_g1_i2.p1  ORF type:complete len:111 (-),score=24.65 TRINITY_DN612_c0_g1_i2:56-388(-)